MNERLTPELESAIRKVAELPTEDAAIGVYRQQLLSVLDELAAVRAERDEARQALELQRAAAFAEAARLLEETGRDDDAVNLLDNVAAGIRANAECQDTADHIGRGNAARFCIACQARINAQLNDPTARPIVVCPGDQEAAR